MICPLDMYLDFHSIFPPSFVAGIRYGIIEGQASIIEIPKGTSDLGLGISWCEEEVSMCELAVCVCACVERLKLGGGGGGSGGRCHMALVCIKCTHHGRFFFPASKLVDFTWLNNCLALLVELTFL